ncbi:MAG: serine hydrolase, partial [Candidatus Glassbacteria bacterium]|nr:serine hydrolase [Candidatus Glassbacteria bacterium]
MPFRIKNILALLALALPLNLPAATENSFEWETTPPELAGLDSVKLAAMIDVHRQHGTKALLVVRNDRIALEWYAEGHGPDKQHYTASLAKALVGGMSLLVALSDGAVQPDDPVWHYIPYWKDDPLRNKITIRQLATHSSGIENAETPGLGHFEQSGWKLRFWDQDPDPFSMASRQAPVIFEPGSRYDYSNPGIGLLSNVITARMKIDVRTLLQQRIMDPIGAPPASYSMGYGETFEVDGLKLVPNWGGGGYTARTIARVGRLMLRRGNWEGRQLVDSTWAHRVVQYAGTPLPPRPDGEPNPAPALGFYSNFDGVWENVPRDAFAGAGAGNQVLLVIPSLGMIIVRNGSLLDTNEKPSFWGGIEKYLLDPVMEAVISPALPASGLIDSISFEPADGIDIAAIDCDNWPITWADDGALYTAYGDGWGFGHEIEKKLSNGLARIDGGPEDWTGINIRTQTGESVGQGPDGSKASGMLSVDGVLYMWMRNTGNSQL